MKLKLFNKYNLLIISTLTILIATLLIYGSISIYALEKSQNQTSKYINAINDLNNIKDLFTKQSNIWKSITLNRNQKDNHYNLYYSFSKHSTSIKDILFNLQLIFLNNTTIDNDINIIKELYNKLTNNQLFVMQNIDFKRKEQVQLQLSQLVLSDKKILTEINITIKKLHLFSRKQIKQLNDFYKNLQITAFLIFLVIALLAAFALLYISKINQKKIISIGKILNSYLPPQLATSILQNKSNHSSHPQRKFLTVCFTDLSGFTAMTENLEPEITANYLDKFLSEMAVIAQNWGGMIDKFMGDGMMILFGAFETYEKNDLANRSIGMAKAMQTQMKQINDNLSKDGYIKPLKLRIGINSGYATIGSIGPKNRRAFTAIGTTVNIASRLEKLCTPNKILISQDTWNLRTENDKNYTIKNTKIKGIKRNIRLYEI